ncbi:gluconate kinase [Canariomyces notabilis]|uniref:Gluconate kinase n=1 Tax=Canariomyces notabilis TaxID=2074819 RepID=A0AAN6YRK8_9PEZI|nr:gluconate kinase [Canariomyces arenarius]
MTVPFLLDDICNLPNDEGIKALVGMNFVGTGGAALGAGVGDRLTAGGVKLLNFYGTTETGPLSLTFAPTDNYNWKYFRLRTDVKYKVDELEPKDGERRFRLTVYPFGAAEGFEIADQLIRNEQYPDTDFAAVGRDDDVIVLATGEKVSPLILETMLNDAPMIKSAVAFGENQFNLGVLVWEIVTAAGQRMDGSGRVPSPDAIIVIPQGAVVPRTDKGSIARKDTYALFDKEIKAVYEKLLQAATEATGPLNLDNLEQDLKQLVHTSLGPRAPVSQWTVEDSLFDLGVDSLQALQLRRVLIAAASKTEGLKDVDIAKLIPPEFIYLNPSVREMAAAITDRSSSGENSLENAAKEVNELVEMYSKLNATPIAPEEEQPSVFENAVVLLTGSSGSLGSHCLADLARRPEVKKVICLIRKEKGTNAPPMPGGGQFDRNILKSRGLELSEEEWAKVATLEVDPTAEKLGLIPMVYAAMQGMVTHVVHAAWPMNYLIRLRSFQYQFKFFQNLLDFAAQNSRGAKRRFIFISSIAVAARVGLSKNGCAVPETPLSPAESACGIGYADGKLVCEKILERAAEAYASQLEAVSIRCGQLTGATNTGVWNANEQIPMLVKTAKSIGSFPQLHGELSWIPVDKAASVVSEIVFSQSKLPTVLHLENPVRQPWSSVVEHFGRQLGLVKPPVSFDEWLDQVASAPSDDELYPVKKLLAFFKNGFRPVACGQVVLSTDVARTHSATLRDMGALDDGTISGYINYWKKIGYLCM